MWARTLTGIREVPAEMRAMLGSAPAAYATDTEPTVAWISANSA